MLNNGQEKIKREAVDWFRNSSEQLFQIEGPAGSGKTFLIYEILKELNLNPNQYMPMAYTGQASIVMRTRGFLTARSIHSSLYEIIEVPIEESRLSNSFNLPKKKKEFRLRQFIDPDICLLFIDEAFMVPKHMVKDIMSFGIKVLVCGDSNQLPPIGDDPGFLVEGNVHRLTELMRQSENSAIIYIAQRALRNLPIHCGIYGNEVMVITDDEITPDMLLYSDCICCGTNKTRESLNNTIRDLRGYSNFQLPTVGERLICRQNNWQLSIQGIALANGLCGTVISPSEICSYDGKIFNINFKPDLIDDCFLGLPINKEYFFSSYERKQEIKQMNKDWIKGELFEYAYALTTHLCQGSEYLNGIYYEEFLRPQLQIALNYTGITRFKNKLIYIKKKRKYF